MKIAAAVGLVLLLGAPRVENDDFLMAMGLGGSLDEAFREATSALASWL